MTDLAALPKPRFTSRETASIGRQIVGTMARVRWMPRLGHFAMAALGANHNSHPTGTPSAYLASARHFVMNKLAYNWQCSDSVMLTSLHTFAPYRRTTESAVPLWYHYSIDADRQIHSSLLVASSGLSAEIKAEPDAPAGRCKKRPPAQRPPAFSPGLLLEIARLLNPSDRVK